MTDTFHDRLDFLMKLTGTKNSVLGRALNFDASYISRIRSGEREVPRHPAFIDGAARFFVRNMNRRQSEAAAEILCPGAAWPENPDQAAELTARWLHSAQGRDTPLEFLSSFTGPPLAPRPGVERAARPRPAAAKTAFFYGNAGKRDAVELFLRESCEGQADLLLFSDENMSWLTEDVSFATLWRDLLVTILTQGGSIRIIHTLGRDLDEMLEGVRKWMPLYMTGGIEPYYCPRIRDGIFRRTLFVARDRMAIFSNSVGAAAGDALTVLTREPAAVSALEAEYRQYFSLCRPLMRIYPSRFGSPVPPLNIPPGGTAAAAGPTPLFPPLPPSLAGRIAPGLLDTVRDTMEHAQGVTELLRLPAPWEWNLNPVRVPFTGIAGEAVRYTWEEYREHLRTALAMMEGGGRYLAVPEPGLLENIAICTWDEGPVLVENLTSPGSLFWLERENLVSAVREYLQRLTEQTARAESIQMLKQYLGRSARAQSVRVPSESAAQGMKKRNG